MSVYEKGSIRTDRGEWIDKGNYAVDPRHRDFAGGADPDGVKDSRAALAAADEHAQAIGQALIIAPGSYKVGTDLTITSEVEMSPGAEFTGAGVVTYSTPGQAVTDKGGTVFNVKAYGGVGDGVTANDTAIDAVVAAGGRPYFPAGTWLVSVGYDIWGTPFHAAGEGVTLRQNGVDYDISGSFMAEFCIRQGTVTATEGFVDVVSARTGSNIAKIANHYNDSQSHRIYLPLDVRRDSHALISGPATEGEDSDILFRALTSGSYDDSVYLVNKTAVGAEALVFLFNTLARGAGFSGDNALVIPSFTTTRPVEFQALPVLLRKQLRMMRGSTGSVELRLDPALDTAFTLYTRNIAGGTDNPALATITEEYLDLSGLRLPVLASPFVGSGSTNPGTGSYRYQITALGAGGSLTKKFYTHTDGNVAIYGRIVVTRGSALTAENGYKEVKFTYVGGTASTPTNTTVDSAGASGLTAQVQKTGSDLEINIVEAGAAGGAQVTGFVEWTLARRRP